MSSTSACIAWIVALRALSFSRMLCAKVFAIFMSSRGCCPCKAWRECSWGRHPKNTSSRNFLHASLTASSARPLFFWAVANETLASTNEISPSLCKAVAVEPTFLKCSSSSSERPRYSADSCCIIPGASCTPLLLWWTNDLQAPPPPLLGLVFLRPGLSADPIFSLWAAAYAGRRTRERPVKMSGTFGVFWK